MCHFFSFFVPCFKFFSSVVAFFIETSHKRYWFRFLTLKDDVCFILHPNNGLKQKKSNFISYLYIPAKCVSKVFFHRNLWHLGKTLILDEMNF